MLQVTAPALACTFWWSLNGHQRRDDDGRRIVCTGLLECNPHPAPRTRRDSVPGGLDPNLTERLRIIASAS